MRVGSVVSAYRHGHGARELEMKIEVDGCWSDPGVRLPVIAEVGEMLGTDFVLLQ